MRQHRWRRKCPHQVSDVLCVLKVQYERKSRIELPVALEVAAPVIAVARDRTYDTIATLSSAAATVTAASELNSPITPHSRSTTNSPQQQSQRRRLANAFSSLLFVPCHTTYPRETSNKRTVARWGIGGATTLGLRFIKAAQKLK